MSNRPSLDDYIDVAERIVAFAEKYPEGSLQTIDWDVRQVGEHTFIVYRAAAYRTPSDKRPGHGIAWEPFPGATPYTRNSELMNAETAAWGRAIVACGLPANRKIASRQEVRARAEEQAPRRTNGQQQPSAPPAQATERPANANQRGLINAKAGAAQLAADELADVIRKAAGAPIKTYESDEQALQDVNRLLDRLPARLVDPVLEGIAAKANDRTPA